MSATRRSARGRLRPGTPARARIWSAVAAVLSVVGIAHCINQFIEGRYLTGRSGNRSSRERWEAYGDGAFSGDSPVHLFLASALVALLLYTVLGALIPGLGLFGVIAVTVQFVRDPDSVGR